MPRLLYIEHTAVQLERPKLPLVKHRKHWKLTTLFVKTVFFSLLRVRCSFASIDGYGTDLEGDVLGSTATTDYRPLEQGGFPLVGHMTFDTSVSFHVTSEHFY